MSDQIPAIPTPTSTTTLTQLVATLNDRIRRINIALGGGSGETAGASATVTYGPHRTRLSKPIAGFPTGSVWYETDRGNAGYQVRSGVWSFLSGTMFGTLAARPSDLGANDAGFLYNSSDAVDYEWSGSAWVAPRGGGQATAARSAWQANTSGGTQPARFGKLNGDGLLHLTLNLSYDGSNWNLDDTTQAGYLLVVRAGTLSGYSCAAHANPVTSLLTQLFTIDAAGNYQIGGTQVVGARQTGWTALTGTATKGGGYATGSVTLSQLAQVVKALVDAFMTSGQIGA